MIWSFIFAASLISSQAFSSDRTVLRKIPINADLKAPESFIHDPQTGFYFISNVNGPPSAKDSNGFIAQIAKDFSVKELNFIRSGKSTVLNGPKGMAVQKGRLYVADIDAVRVFDLKTGRLIRARSLSQMEPKFLNDICILGRWVYVTDTGAKKIFQLDLDLQVCKVLCKLRFAPNGITPSPEKKSLTVVTWGPGKILKVDPKGKVELLFDGAPKGLRNLDGVAYDKQGNLYFSSFTKGVVYTLSRSGRLNVLATGLVTAADIGIDSEGRLLVPLMQKNRAVVLELKKRTD